MNNYRMPADQVYGLQIVTPPTEEPVTLAQAKAQLRVDISDDDALITLLIQAARERVELELKRALVTQTWQMVMPTWPGFPHPAWAMYFGWFGNISSWWGMTTPAYNNLYDSFGMPVPWPPLQSVTWIKYIDPNGATQTLSTSIYNIRTVGAPGRIYLRDGQTWPTTTRDRDPITMQYVAGYGAAAAVPASIKQAILMIVGSLYENREEVLAMQGVSQALVIPNGVDSLLAREQWGSYG